MSRNQADRSWISAPIPAPCRCGHSRSYHRQVDNRYLHCFASPMLAPPCDCPQYLPGSKQ